MKQTKYERAEYKKRWYEKNKERILESRREYRENNKDKIAVWKKNNYQNKKEEEHTIEEMKIEHMNEYIEEYRTKKEKNRDYHDKHPVIQFCDKVFPLKRHKGVPTGYVWHHMCYDHADPEAYIVLMSVEDHTRAHAKMRKFGIKIPHINQQNL